MASLFRHPAAVVLCVLLVLLAVVSLLMVPWGHPEVPSAASRGAALSQLPADVVARGKEFAAAIRPGSYLSLLVGLVVAVVLGLTPVGARIVAAIGKPFGGHWLAEAVLGGLAIVLIAQLVTLPFAAWGHSIQVRYGMSTQTWGAWSLDMAKSLAISVVLSALALAALYSVIRFAPKWWWAIAAAGAGALVVLMSAIYPIVFEPVFNSFTPMSHGQLRTELMDMAADDGVPVKDVLVSDASIRTNAVNAYVSGLGPTRRIVVYDNLLQAPDAEVKSVVAHELGHAKENDVWIGTALGALGTAAAVCLIPLLGSATGLLRRAGVDSVTSPRAVALLLAMAAIVGLLATPLQNAVSRSIERRADLHALQLTDDPQTMATMQANLAKSNLSDVDPPGFIHWYFGSHPSTVERIAMAREYAR